MTNYFCGHEPPIALYTYDNWTHHETTGDQKCIEAILPAYVTPESTWLHIGIGNSSLAKLYAAQIYRLDGITVAQEEIDTAPKLGNYHVRWCDKHGREFLTDTRYDVIIDTTPCGHACCWKHWLDYMIAVFKMLKPGGSYLTDKVGLAWAQPTFKGMTPETFGVFLATLGCSWKMLNDTVIEVKRCGY